MTTGAPSQTFTIPYHAMPCHTMPYDTISCHTKYHTTPYHTIPYHTIPYHTMGVLPSTQPYHAIVGQTCRRRRWHHPAYPYTYMYGKVYSLSCHHLCTMQKQFTSIHGGIHGQIRPAGNIARFYVTNRVAVTRVMLLCGCCGHGTWGMDCSRSQSGANCPNYTNENGKTKQRLHAPDSSTRPPLAVISSPPPAL